MAASRPRYSTCGGGSMAELRDATNWLTIEAATSHLPMWTEWGVRDVGHLVHSLGCTFLTAVGRDLGFSAASELPAPREGALAHGDEDVRSHSDWFVPQTHPGAI